MPRARIHPDHAAACRANAQEKRAAGIVRKTLEVAPEIQQAISRIRDDLGLRSDRDAITSAIIEYDRKLARSRK